jgi:hypothetical protein
MTDLHILIKACFLEAADTEWRLPRERLGPDGYGSSMPAYIHSFADMVGWGKERLAEERRLLARRLPPSAEAISRHDECLRWTAEMITIEAHRRALWAWAFSVAVGRSFREWCRREHISHMTGYRRVDAAVRAISSISRKNIGFCINPADEWVLRVEDISGMKSVMVGDSTGRSRQHWRAADADPACSSDPYMAALAERQRVNREAKRRALLGVA